MTISRALRARRRSSATAPRRARRLRGLAGTAALGVAVLLAGCSAGTSPDGTAAAPVTAAPTVGVDDASGAPPEVANATDLTVRPAIGAGTGLPPVELTTTDLVVGTGATADLQSTVLVHYVGAIWATGQEFDASWDDGQPVEFPLSGVIPGFAEGIDGMQVGGRRMIIIPPDLGYGPSGGREPYIKVDDTLVFVVDLLDIVDPAAGATEDPTSAS
ncbi:MAG: FKBP-type peptidyl-prolyl cis-trans isomerase [Frankia sp.]|nr:FKBP-type peptidyl-prolyl cis-trans isomerase [Frankia sp.]